MIATEANTCVGKLPTDSMLINVPKLIASYYTEKPDISIPAQRVIFGTSGHRGSSLNNSFNEWHILAITQAICLYRKKNGITGPLFLGIDTHALSIPAFRSAMEVLSANQIEVMLASSDEYTPTPVISHAILAYNRIYQDLADGIIVTPSHNPPYDGGFKYNPPSGGPANIHITTWIQNKANDLLEKKLKDIKRISFEQALQASTTHRYDYLNNYINDLKNVVDMDVIKKANIHIGVDPLGGAGVHYWEPIAELYKLNLTIVNKKIDPTFYFVPVDWDGEIRMNPASPYAMKSLIDIKEKFDIAFACDTDHDRHGIVSPHSGLISTNHYLSIASFYLFMHRTKWSKKAALGKTVVTTHMLNNIAQQAHRQIVDVPVGFKWFVDGLLDGTLNFCGESSAGAVFNRMNGDVWTTDKDGIIAGLLSAEITAQYDCDISEIYTSFEKEFGKMYSDQRNTKATLAEKEKLANLSKENIHFTTLAGDKIESILTQAPGNHQPIQGIKVVSKNGWFVARASGTESIYEICAESFKSPDHLQMILDEAQTMVNKVLQT
ncbi:MAG: alpha-D-glucose phosphate-specific phosphoglucomutase [Gammaproteobacteria bacterium]|nr:alpha-D-glucose phosphate-specific phosphoglucomutase [Gammaproteobacteria bacterium]